MRFLRGPILTLFATILTVCYAQTTRSQPLKIGWSIKPGGSIQRAAYLTPLKQGGYAVVTQDDSTRSGLYGLTDAGHPPTLTVVNSDGSVRWKQVYDDSLGILGSHAGVAEMSDGDIVAIAERFDPLGSRHDVWVTRYESSGNIRWSKLYGGSADEYPRSICAASDASCIIVSSTNSTDGDVANHHGGELDIRGFPPLDAWIVKLDRYGEIEWQRCLGSTGTDYIRSMVPTQDGSFVFCGTASGVADGDIGAVQGGGDMWIGRIDLKGSILWQRCYGGSKGDNGDAVVSTIDGGILAVGHALSQDGDVIRPKNNTSPLWILKLDSAGKVEWQQTIGDDSSYNVIASSVIQSLDDGYVIAGEIDTSYAPNVPRRSDYHGGNRDAWLAKIDRFGGIVWQQLFGGSESDYFTCIALDPDGSYIAAGRSSSRDQDVMGLDSAAGGWVLKTIELSSSARSVTRDLSLSVHPNPTSGTTCLSYWTTEPTDCTFEVSDLLGRTVWRRAVALAPDNHTESLNLSFLDPGSYWVTASAQGKVMSCRLVIQ